MDTEFSFIVEKIFPMSSLYQAGTHYYDAPTILKLRVKVQIYIIESTPKSLFLLTLFLSGIFSLLMTFGLLFE
jgi:hypothetical protein